MKEIRAKAGEIVKCLLESEDLIGLAGNLLICGEDLRRRRANYIFEEIYRLLLERVPAGGEAYYIADETNWVPIYLLLVWSPSDEISENIHCWHTLAEWLLMEFERTDRLQISENQIRAVMQHLERQYRFCTKILANRPAYFLVLPNRHKSTNSQYYVDLALNIPNKEIILLLNIIEEGDQAEAIFLHELGHLLHTRLTGEQWVPPKSFDFLQQAMYNALDDCPKREWCEYFADSFAVAALQDSSFRPNAYMSMYWEDDKAAIGEYYRVLMDIVEQNPKGQLSWDELQKF